jgi:hypothetical protein
MNMTGELHQFTIPAQILKRGFWLYIWKVGLPDGTIVHYVGMTGDTGAALAQSAMNRVAAHLGRNIKSNALRRYLKSKCNIDLEDCASIDFYAFGPVYDKPSVSDYSRQRGKVAALEKHLWAQMQSGNYKMLNRQPQSLAELDSERWKDVWRTFRKVFRALPMN